MPRKIYVASSWRNPIQPEIVRVLREAGHEVYDFREPAEGNHGFHWSEVDPNWKNWTPESFSAYLYSENSLITEGFSFDRNALEWCDTCVLVLPCGRSAHLEAGMCIGQGKLTLFYLHPDKFEPELMYLLGNGCVTTHEDLLLLLEHTPRVCSPEQKSIASWFQRNGGRLSSMNVHRATEEYLELMQAVGDDDLDNIREEMADVVICLMVSAHAYGFDLLKAVRDKHEVNKTRSWVKDAFGCLKHVAKEISGHGLDKRRG